MRLRSLLGPMKIVVGSILAFELVVRLLAGIGWIALEVGDVRDSDRLLRAGNVLLSPELYKTDRDLIFRMRPDFSAIYPRSFLFPGQPETFSVETNDLGFRTGPFSDGKSPEVFRIVSVGGSSTFGMNVEADSGYPNVLAELLEERLPGRFQVLNLGVPGYSSRQSLELIRQRIVGYEPDLVLLECGGVTFLRSPGADDITIRASQRGSPDPLMARHGLDRLYSYRAARQTAIAAGDRFFDTPGLRSLREPDGEDPEPAIPRRVTLKVIREAIVQGRAESAQAGAEFIVLNFDLWQTDARESIQVAVAETGTPYLDILNLFDEARRDRTRRIERVHGLGPVAKRKKKSLLRVRAPDSSGVRVEWTVSMRRASRFDEMWDDGSHGDQVAGDGIWSLYIPARTGNRVVYAYWQTTAGGESREFQPRRRSRMDLIPDSGVLGIDDYGHYFLHADNLSPDGDGHRLIAKALLPAVLEIERRGQ